MTFNQMQPELAISSIGVPHELHAIMMRHLSHQHAVLWEQIDGITKGGYVRDANPKTQGKLCDRIKAAGASFVHLEPGKRGNYKMIVSDLIGWNPHTDRIIAVGDPIPKTPWLANLVHTIDGLGHGHIRYTSQVSTYLTHHCLSRVTQHWMVRTLPELLRVAETTDGAVMRYDLEVCDDERSHMPPEGIRIPINSVATAVLKRHEKYNSFVVVTIFAPN
jgi:hypothetical protein